MSQRPAWAALALPLVEYQRMPPPDEQVRYWWMANRRDVPTAPKSISAFDLTLLGDGPRRFVMRLRRRLMLQTMRFRLNDRLPLIAGELAALAGVLVSQ